jgi:RNA polymerase sigma-32 factor
MKMEARHYRVLPLSGDLARKYIGDIEGYPVLSREEEFEVTRLVYEKGDRDAIRMLVLSNLRLVVKIALDYCKIHHNILDLIQEGNVGLLQAARKYSPYRGTKFSSYAAKWIKAYIMAYLINSRCLVR